MIYWGNEIIHKVKAPLFLGIKKISSLPRTHVCFMANLEKQLRIGCCAADKASYLEAIRILQTEANSPLTEACSIDNLNIIMKSRDNLIQTDTPDHYFYSAYIMSVTSLFLSLSHGDYMTAIPAKINVPVYRPNGMYEYFAEKVFMPIATGLNPSIYRALYEGINIAELYEYQKTHLSLPLDVMLERKRDGSLTTDFADKCGLLYTLQTIVPMFLLSLCSSTSTSRFNEFKRIVNQYCYLVRNKVYPTEGVQESVASIKFFETHL